MTIKTSLEDDLLSPATTADPYPFLAELRRRDPVHWSERHKAWLLTRHDDVAAAYGDGRLSSDRARPLMESLDPERRARLAPLVEAMSHFMVVNDPPVHTRLRRLADSAFRQQRVASMATKIEQLVDELLDDFIESGQEDFISHFAYPLPAAVIAEMLGAPASDRDRFRTWSDEFALVAFGVGSDDRPDRHDRAMRGLAEMVDYFEGLVEQARHRPADDMLSSWLETDDRGDALTNDELTSMCALMLFAGHETTTNLLANGLLTLLRHPDQLAAFRSSPGLVQRAVEELLRFEGPIKLVVRWVSHDLHLRGKEISAGERVFLLNCAANRDPERFPDPDRFDITRSPNPHLGFGRGIHVCIGAQLARIEARLALSRVFDRLPGLRLADEEPDWKSNLSSRALDRLLVAHDATIRL
jgi:cytochrome P450